MKNIYKNISAALLLALGLSAGSAQAQYCSSGLGGGSAPIDSVKITGTTLSNTTAVGTTSNVSANYSMFPASGNTTATLSQAITYTLEVATPSSSIVSVWIDYDQSGTFDATEWTQVATTSVVGNNTVALSIPTTSALGNTGMRIRTRLSGNANGAADACTNMGSGETEDYEITIVAGVPCSGVPTAGILTVGNTTPCPYTASTITLAGTTQAVGVTTSWETSANGTTGWVATGDSSISITDGGLNSGDSIYYRVAVSCNGGAPVYTNIIKLKANTNFFACYCSSTATNTADDDIGGFEFGSFTNNVSTTPALSNPTSVNLYTDYTGLAPIQAQQVVSYPVKITQINSGSFYACDVTVFIDLDHSGSYDAGENVYVGTTIAGVGGNVLNGTISIPSTSLTGLTGLRVVLNETGLANACGTYTWGETEDYIINITAGVTCSGTPTAGTLTVTDSTPCPSIATTITLAGTTAAVGITTVWETSANGTTGWVATGDSSISITDGGVNAGDSIYYRVAVSCNGGAPVYTNVIKLLANPNFFACYCTSNATSTADDDIGGFEFGSFTNNVSTTPATNNPASVNLYTDYTGLAPIQAQQVVSYPITITQINQAGAYACDVTVFVDLDHSGSFDAGENLYVGTTTNLVGGNVLSGTITIPATSLTGLTGLRVVLNESTVASACGTYTWGETEDYIINITAGVTCSGAPTAGTLTVSDSTPCPSIATTITLAGTTAAVGITTVWETSANGTTGWVATGDSSISITDGGVNAGDSIYYRVAVSCNGGAPVYTNVIKILANPNFFACYCTSTATNTADDDIGGFEFGSFTNNVSTTPALSNATSVNLYTDFTGLAPIQAQQVVNYPITITQINSSATFYGCTATIFVDLDHSGSFDAGEDLYTGTTTAGAGNNILTGTISIPGASLTGLTGLRIVLRESGTPAACGTYSYGETEDYIINITPGIPCAGTPTAGTLTVGNTMPCPGTTSTITLAGTTQAIGITTSWETSIDNLTYTATGDSSFSVTDFGLAAGDSIYYRVAVSCNGGAPVYTNVIKLLANPNFFACYCSSNLGGGSQPIDSVQIVGTTLNNAAVGTTSNVSPNYSSFPATGATTASLMQSLNYTLNVGAATTSSISVWIDYDQSGTFDASEWTQVATNSSSPVSTVSLMIPATATLGNTGMRVRSNYSWSTNGSGNACNNMFGGETEDYIVNIIAGTPCAGTPTAGTLTASNLTPCPNTASTITLAGTTQAMGITTVWEASIDNVNFTATGDSLLSITDFGLAAGDSIYYRVAVSCNGGAPVYTNVVMIKTNPNTYACYCSANLGGGGTPIDSVSITPSTFANVAIGTNSNVSTNYSTFSATGTILIDSTYTMNVGITSGAIVSMWIDYDHSGAFEAAEWTQVATTTVAGVNTVSFTVPSAAMLGNTGLRIRSRLSGNTNGAVDACTNMGSGETEDYIIKIDTILPITPPVAIAKQIASVNFVAYPNPTMDVVTIAIAGATNQAVICEVLNSFGQVIYTNKVKNVNGVEKLSVNLANYASGSYMIRVTSNDNVTVKRVALQR
ncbi:MAG: GEVED domain-containing protein [Bacteroidia bacterium]